MWVASQASSPSRAPVLYPIGTVHQVRIVRCRMSCNPICLCIVMQLVAKHLASQGLTAFGTESKLDPKAIRPRHLLCLGRRRFLDVSQLRAPLRQRPWRGMWEVDTDKGGGGGVPSNNF